MRKNNLLLLIGAAVAMPLFLSSCDKNKNKNEEVTDPFEQVNDEGDQQRTVVDTMLTPEASKKYLMSTGQRMLNIFDAADQKDAINLLNGMIDKMEREDWEWEAFEKYAEKKADAMFAAPRYVARVASGKTSPAATEICVFTFADYSVVFEANEATKTWENKGAADDNSCIVRMQSNRKTTLEAKCWGEGEMREYSFTYYMDKDGNFEEKPFKGAEAYTMKATIPQILRFTFKEDDKVLVNVTQEIDLVENDHYLISGTYSIVNLTWAQKINVAYDQMSMKMLMKYNNSNLYVVNVSLPSYDIVKRQDGETYVEYGERVADRWEALLKGVGEAVTEVDLLNTVQIKARVSSIGGLYKAYMDWEKSYDVDLFDDMSLKAADALRSIYNKYCIAGIYYNSDMLQAQMEFESSQDGKSGKYYIEPVILFPSDDTRYAYGEYFTASRFGDVIDLTEKVANSYIRLLTCLGIDEDIKLR